MSPSDVIVVGGGAAGCVLASRLSEESQRNVLLIEAGPDVAAPGLEHPDVLDPFCLMATNNSAFHWPELVAATSAARSPTRCIQGFGVGGGSNINGMAADRGLPGDYQEWCDLGAQGWNWEAVLPYFIKLEQELDFTSSNVHAMHGDRGPMPVRRLPRSRWAPFAAAIGNALERQGFPFIDDYMTDFRDGFSAVPTNCLPAGRVSAATAYLTHEVRRRPNLKILANTRVDRLSFEGRKANGVFMRCDGETQLVRGREIIVACGALQSPALLMRSGIGPGEHLAKHGIEVVQDLPGVGANLQNHPHVGLIMYLRRAAAQPPENVEFLQNWLRYSSNHGDCSPSDMHLMAFNKLDWHALGTRTGYVVVSALKAYSRGCVRLSSSDPGKAPTVQFNALADSRDEERLASGLRFILGLLADPTVAALRREIFIPDPRWVARLHRRNAWNRLRANAITHIFDLAPLRHMLLAKSYIDPQSLLDDERALRSFVRAHVQVQLHVCGTCRMGRADDANAVVDSTGRVYGLEGLRVADASIFPTLPRGYTHFIVMMVAEKLADSIKAESRGRS